MLLVRKLFDGPIDIVGDVHGESGCLLNLLDRLGYDANGVHKRVAPTPAGPPPTPYLPRIRSPEKVEAGRSARPHVCNIDCGCRVVLP